MLTLYHAPISPNSRRVWITLIEKGLEFELVEIKLNEEQFTPEFLAINPLHHIPALVDDDFKIIESLAILDYLEVKYPKPAMLPTEAKDLAIARMVQLVTVNELLPATTVFLPQVLGLPGENPEKIEQAKQKISVVMKLLESLHDQRPYFGSEQLTLADVVAGTVVPWLPIIGIPLNDYPKMQAWCDRLIARPSWQTTETTPEAMEAFKAVFMARMTPASAV
ncbi:glutathione S-transferase family protein [Fortiea contorta]|uniref:glutathione S-transferase family protein n=1 Tax=Fortiea contorta TaxID=1892405 RepID=UPI00034B7577|nr:glutathione S-transferase family protein [Fortiea contorta]